MRPPAVRVKLQRLHEGSLLMTVMLRLTRQPATRSIRPGKQVPFSPEEIKFFLPGRDQVPSPPGEGARRADEGSVRLGYPIQEESLFACESVPCRDPGHVEFILPTAENLPHRRLRLLIRLRPPHPPAAPSPPGEKELARRRTSAHRIPRRSPYPTPLTVSHAAHRIPRRELRTLESYARKSLAIIVPNRIGLEAGSGGGVAMTECAFLGEPHE